MRRSSLSDLGFRASRTGIGYVASGPPLPNGMLRHKKGQNTHTTDQVPCWFDSFETIVCVRPFLRKKSLWLTKGMVFGSRRDDEEWQRHFEDKQRWS
jgi:hypothetical protein